MSTNRARLVVGVMAAVVVATAVGGSLSASVGVPRGRIRKAPRQPASVVDAPLPPIPKGLQPRLGIGVMAPPSQDGIYGWLPDSGVPFDYAYQYLAGGANTGNGWQTWNPRAEFPLAYALGASAHHYIPVLDYYMLLQSNGPCGSCGEAEKDLAHLDNPATMLSYLADFAKLMQRLGTGTWDGVKGYGAAAVVHVEPDLSAYAQQAVLHRSRCYGHCLASGNDPSMLHAAVASTGMPELAGYLDTYRGFNLALLHLRDRYAPNVLLAFHVSGWSTGVDIGSSTRSLDASALGARAAKFAGLAGVTTSAAGTSTYDLLFTDVADRDAGVSHIWWDQSNQKVPNFSRWEDYVRTVGRVTGRWMMVWQVPLGNQWFRTEDGSDGHNQDNRIGYFFAHPRELVGAGVAAVLYGRGSAGSTTNSDAKHDGVTNPPPVCTTAGAARQVCGVEVSTSPDDDGGFLRMRAAEYYHHPLALQTATAAGS